MPLGDVHVRFLTSHHRRRLATVGPNGSPQNKPVDYRYNPEHGTIVPAVSAETRAERPPVRLSESPGEPRSVVRHSAGE